MKVAFKSLFSASAIVALLAAALAPSPQWYNEAAGEFAGISTAAQLPVVAGNLPVRKSDAKPFDTPAIVALALDLKSGRVLYEKNGSLPRPMASLAKLMTALVVTNLVLESDVVEVRAEELEQLSPPVMGLVAGERISARSLLRGMLIMSANDAAAVLARAAGGSPRNFAELMNAMGLQLGLQHTQFKNATGFDQSGQYATAEDWTRITREFLKNPVLAEIVQIRQLQVTSTDKKIRHWLKTTNHLLRKDRIIGVKTGYTDEARGNLILLVGDEQGNKILTIVLGSEHREEDSQALVRWVFDSFTF